MTNEQRCKEAIENLELDTLHQTGVGNISGGFARAAMIDWDDDHWKVELKWGVQSDCQDTVHTYHYKINKQTLEAYEL